VKSSTRNWPAPMKLLEGRLDEAIAHADLHLRRGRVSDIIGLIIEATGLEAQVGEVCEVQAGRFSEPVKAEVVGFRAKRTLLMPLGEMTGIGPGNVVTATGTQLRAPVGPGLLGRVLDGLGAPIDRLGPVDFAAMAPVQASPPDPLTRPRITDRLGLGVRSLDALVPCGRGQRLGIFAGSGVGKSSLLGMIARAADAADAAQNRVNVICLVGERGREVREFVERDLGDALRNSVVVVSTSDQPALVRIKAALTATTIAEWFRDQGFDVMLMMDSVTRFAMAQREVGLAIGEPPATRGYTPSVFAILPKLLERSGTSPSGSITALYTVLVDGDDMNEPIADAVRGILDGHVVLSRKLAHAGHYPAIDVLSSVSRLVGEIVTPAIREAGNAVRGLMATYQEKSDLIAIGAYQPGSDPATDAAIAARAPIDAFLRQGVTEPSSAEEADQGLSALATLSPDALAAGPGPVPVIEGTVEPPGGGTPLHNAIPPLHIPS
jgi:flagellum-specific ATP synthase